MKASGYAYWAKMGFLEWLAWPASTLDLVVSYPILVFAQSFLFRALYGGRAELAGYALREMLAYVTLGWLMRTLYKTGFDRVIGNKVRKGDISFDLLRPVSFFWMVLSQALGRTGYRALAIGLPATGIVLFLQPILYPPGAEAALGFAASLALGYLLDFSLQYLTGVSAFLIEFSEDLAFAVDTAAKLLGGLFVPLAFAPEWLANAISRLPFVGIYSIPIQIYLGKLSGAALWAALAHQALWLLALVAAGNLIFRIGARKLSIQGG